MGKRWIKLDKVISTNSYISTLLSRGTAVDEMVVVADYQEAGKGQGSHSWHSLPGENLLMSLLLFPAFLSASSQFRLSMVVSLAITDTLHALGISAKIKWPNDILTLRGKIAGILIEHSISGGQIAHSIVGVGLNLNQVTFPDFSTPATSVRLESGAETVPGDLARRLVLNLESRYDMLEKGESQTLSMDYLEHLHLLNVPARFRSVNESFEGEIMGVNEFGELQVKKGNQIETFMHGEIEEVRNIRY